MKILQINSVYGVHSTGKLTQALHRGLLAQGHQSLVAYGRGPASDDPHLTRLCPDWYGRANNLLSRLTGMPYGGCLLSTARLLRLIRREKPDVVHLQCVNGYFVNIYWLVGWLKRHRIKTVVSLHAEFMYTANCGHAFDCEQWVHGCRRCPDKYRAVKSWLFDRTGASWRRMRNAFAGFAPDCIVAPVSPWTEERARRADILQGFRFQTVYNGVDAEQVFRPDGPPPACLPDGLPAGPLVLHPTAFFSAEPEHNKGGWYLLELACRLPQVTFVVAGKHGAVPPLPPNLVLLGMVTDQQQLAALYRRADLTLLTSRRETFSMPCAESLCCGTPVVGFCAGAPERIALAGASQFVPYGDLDALQRCVEQWLAAPAPDRRALADRANAAYSQQTMVQEFLSLYRRLLCN